MIVLTDIPFWTEHLMSGLSTDLSWSLMDVRVLPPAEQTLWQALGSDPQISRLEFPAVGPLSFWDYLIIVDHANESQFDVLQRLDPECLPGQVACVAAQGQGFHGHRQRIWQTLPGNLHLSALCRPDLDAANCGLAMTTLPAVAVIDSLNTLGPWPAEVGIKWVNDILMDDHKIAGVITAIQSFRGMLSALTVGIGLNVLNRPTIPSSAFVPCTACLADFRADDTEVGVGRLLFACLTALAQRLQTVQETGPDSLIQAYRNASLVVGRTVAIWPDGVTEDVEGTPICPPSVQGVVTDIGPDLALTVEGCHDPICQGRLILINDD